MTSVRIDRPLTDDERRLLIDVAAKTIADGTGCTYDEAVDVLHHLAAEKKLIFDGDAEAVDVHAAGNPLVHAERDWLSFHAQYGRL